MVLEITSVPATCWIVDNDESGTMRIDKTISLYSHSLVSLRHHSV